MSNNSNFREPQQIEKIVAKNFLSRILNKDVDEAVIVHGDASKSEPDILFDDLGIEIGAAMHATNKQVDKYEANFISTASSLINNKILGNIQIRLVFQDDKNQVLYTPTEKFSKYSCLPNYAKGVFVNKYFNNINISTQIVINQQSRERVNTYPNINNNKEIKLFVDELTDFVNSLSPSDFKSLHLNNCKYKTHHAIICNGKLARDRRSPIDDFVSKNIVDKLKRNKYKGNYSKQILLLHNFSLEGNMEFTSDIHFYTHHRELIFNKIKDYILKFDSFKIYDEIYFIDFSEFAYNLNFKLINFKEYEKVAINDNLATTGEIRFNLTREEN